jgi:hypothetical protein
MNWQLLGPLLITTAIAVAGWFVGHALSARRDRINKRREQRIGYLIEAYRRLETCANRGDQMEASKFESALADIQLFGTPRQVDLVQALIADFAAGGGATMDDLLRDLRRDLRAELRLQSVPDRILHLRIRNDKRAA